jgi:hypothetical protein
MTAGRLRRIAVGARLDHHVLALVAVEARRAVGRERAVDLVRLVRGHHVGRDQGGAVRAAVRVVHLVRGEQRVERVALEGLRHLDRDQLDRLLEERVLDREVRDVGDDHAVPPLLGGRRHLEERHRLAGGRDAFLQRAKGSGRRW